MELALTDVWRILKQNLLLILAIVTISVASAGVAEELKKAANIS